MKINCLIYFFIPVMTLILELSHANAMGSSVNCHFFADTSRLKTSYDNDVNSSLSDSDHYQSPLWVRQHIESELTLLENKNRLIPLMKLDTLRIASLSIGASQVTPFQKMLGNYTKVDHYQLNESCSTQEQQSIFKKLAAYNLVITGIYPEFILGEAEDGTCEGISRTDHTLKTIKKAQIQKWLRQLGEKHRSVFVFFGDPVILSVGVDLGHPDVLLIAGHHSSLHQELAAQLLFGGIGASGRLTASIELGYAAGEGIPIDHPIRLKYTIPEEVGLNSLRFNNGIDSIVNHALSQKAFPGCNVLVAKDGKVIFQKAYGYHTFDEREPESTDDIYDLASVTKTTGALPAMMKLHEEGKLLLDEPFSTYWPDWNSRFLHPSNKGDLTVREMLAHQSGLVPFIPFWRESMHNDQLSSRWYRVAPQKRFALEVAPGLYLNSRFKKKIYKTIRKSPIKSRGKYVYSDLSVLLTPEVVSRLTGMKYTDYLAKNFYNPLGASTTTYLPAEKFSNEQIIPTEYDSIYRNRLVHASVHDESAAVMGGIAGNAGLFSSANDLAKLIQMYLQNGAYGGKQYLQSSTLETFNSVQYPLSNNRRGLGFDKPLLDNFRLDKESAYPCKGASAASFGHFGFTGTFFWVDPECGLTYIFLSNRVYPTRANSKISDLNVRTDILQFVYDQLNSSKKE